ncbi:MAG: cytochrome c [Acidobacteriota bacterium]
MRPNAGIVVFVAATALASHAGAQPSATAPTFSKDVAPIFFDNCTTCHRPGEATPMSLLTYKEARPWARSIAARVRDGVMPPWHADPAIGRFANERRLTSAEKETILRWVEAGAPEGDAKDLPPAPTYPSGWTIGTPDAVVEMQEDYPIPASGEVPYVYFEVPANFDEDRWVQAWEMRPGNPSVVHHVIVYVKPPAPPGGAPAPNPGAALAAALRGPARQPLVTFHGGTRIPAGQTGGPPLPEEQRKALPPNDRPRIRGTQGSMGGYVPGNSYRVYPAGSAMRLPKGASLVFQMHYTPNGTATTDRTKMAFIFAKEPPARPLNTLSLINGELHIPAGAKDHRVDASMTFNRDVVLFSLTPHTHVRGVRWHYEVEYPDGRREPFLSVPNYDFNWQHEYQFVEPMRLPGGTTIHASAWYDNSPSNKSNPDPTKDVFWGDQTWEEMMFTSFTFHVPPAPSSTPQR